MSRCRQCNHESAENSIFCSKCGTFFETFVEYKPSAEKYAEEMQKGVGTRIYSFRSAQLREHFDEEVPTTARLVQTGKLHERRNARRMSRRAYYVLRVVRSIFYFAVALPLAIYGLFTGIVTMNDSTRIASLALFCALGMMIIGIVVFYSTRHRRVRFGWPQFLLTIVIATVGWMMAMLLEYTVMPDFSTQAVGQLIFGLLFSLYGCALAFASLW